jgi:beta-glucosidase
MNKQLITDHSKFTLSIDITNLGNHDGAEIVQVYSHDVDSSIIRPPKELVGFMKVFLKPKETQTIHIPLKPDDFAFYSPSDRKWIIEEGLYELLVSSSSKNIEQIVEARISN